MKTLVESAERFLEEDGAMEARNFEDIRIKLKETVYGVEKALRILDNAIMQYSKEDNAVPYNRMRYREILKELINDILG